MEPTNRSARTTDERPSAMRLDRLALLAALLFATLAFALWTSDLRPLARDEATAYLRSLDLLDRLTGADRGLLALPDEIILHAPAGPPGLALLHLPFLAAAGGRIEGILVLHLALAVALCGAMAGIARRLLGTATPALVFLLTAPSLLYLATRPTPAFPLTCLAAVAVHLALASEGFSRRGPSVGYGLTTGLGLLVSPSFALFLLGPTAGLARNKIEPDRPRRVPAYLPVALGIAAILAVPWYVAQEPVMAAEIRRAISEKSYKLFSISGLFFYIKSAFEYDIHGLFGPLAILGLFPGADPRRRAARALVMRWVLIPLMLLTVLPWRDPDILVPVLPGVALQAAAMWTRIESRHRRAAAVVVCLAIQGFGLTNVFFDRDLPVSGFNRWKGTGASERFAPLPYDFGVRRLARDLAATPGIPRHRPLGILVVPDHTYLNGPTLAAHLAMAGLRAHPLDLPADPDPATLEALLFADAIILTDGFPGAGRARAAAILRARIERTDRALPFRQVAALSLADGSMVWMLARTEGEGEHTTPHPPTPSWSRGERHPSRPNLHRTDNFR